MTLDGSFEGPNKELDWHVRDDEMEEYMSDLLNNVDAILLGRVVYQLLADYWPNAISKTTMPRNPREEHPFIIEKMNNLPKIILSETLVKIEWKNSTVIKEMSREGSRNLNISLAKIWCYLVAPTLHQDYFN